MGIFDGFTGSPSRDGIVGSVIRRSLGAESLEIRKGLAGEILGAGRQVLNKGADTVRGVAHEATDGVLSGGRRQTSNNGDGVERLPTRSQYNASTQNFLNQFGPNRQSAQPQGGLLGGIGAFFSSFLPKTDDRAAPQREPKNNAPIVDRSSYSPDVIAQMKKEGRNTDGLRVTPPEKPIVTTVEPAPSELPAGNPIAAPQVGLPQDLHVQPVKIWGAIVEPGDFQSLSKEPREPLPGANKVGRWDDVLSRPSVSTPLDLTTSFKVAGSGVTQVAAPAIPAAAEFHSKLGDDVYARAQAFVAQSGPKPNGPS